ncbi:hypothetical protein BIW11_06599 [Tropilaelaps mercedesae]|uniref:Uncharacterized protein n=1 Tax=Tropilaelaps mercedesae TaxID=418985 RepID=A0A1V9XXD4_9ACAR|nr:hypothetical protein BIW11_06599 [Tropilaelaps mercedesae]
MQGWPVTPVLQDKQLLIPINSLQPLDRPRPPSDPSPAMGALPLLKTQPPPVRRQLAHRPARTRQLPRRAMPLRPRFFVDCSSQDSTLLCRVPPCTEVDITDSRRINSRTHLLFTSRRQWLVLSPSSHIRNEKMIKWRT